MKKFSFHHIPIPDFVKKHERHMPALALALGFVWDVFTLGGPDRIFDNSVIIAYLSISAFGIVFLSLKERRGATLPIILLGLIQFSFGNLAGGFLVLYGRSAVFPGSALFILILLAFLVGNEFLKSRYGRISFNVSVWFFLLFAYSALIIPVLIGTIGDAVFLLSTVLSFGIVTIFITVLYVVAHEPITRRLKEIFPAIIAIIIVWNALYFFNIIPPVPLALKEGGIYHSVYHRPEGDYKVTYEKPRWYEIWKNTSSLYHTEEGGLAYCFSSVFAPARLTAPIYHRWEYYDKVKEEWVTALRIPFSIVGGRETGYRGYTEKGNMTLGLWRCNVETIRGTLIGRSTVEVVPKDASYKILDKIL